MGNCCSKDSDRGSGDPHLSTKSKEECVSRSISSTTKRRSLETFDPDTIDFIPHRKEIIKAKVIDV